MSGHSKWAKTHRQKAASDAKRGAIFTKLGNLITLAARQGGGDPEINFKLRLAVEKAKNANMPKDNIERAITRGAGNAGEGEIIEETVYEAFGPAKSALLIETVSDNKNRTLTEIKTILTKNGGQLAGSGSVKWMFSPKGEIIVSQESLQQKNPEELELALIDAGAEEIAKNNSWKIQVPVDQLQEIETKIQKNLGMETKESALIFRAKPENQIKINDPAVKNKIAELIKALEKSPDVSNIFTNVA